MIKRDFNIGAHIFLGLIIIEMVIESLTSYVSIKNQSYFGEVNYGLFLKHLLFNFLILISALYTFAKKPTALKLLIAFFILRAFICVPSTGALYSYYVGSNIATLLRDFGPFAIAMCFKKDGISGWKAMLASKETLFAMYSKEEATNITTETNIPKGIVNDDSIKLDKTNDKDKEKQSVENNEPKLENQNPNKPNVEFIKSYTETKRGLRLNKTTAYFLIAIIDFICLFLFSLLLVTLNMSGYLPMIIFFTFISWLSKALFSYFTSNSQEAIIVDSSNMSETKADDELNNLENIEISNNSNAEEQVITKDNLPVIIQLPEQPEVTDSVKSKKEFIKPRIARVLFISLLGVVVIGLAILALKPYPDYLRSWSDKIKYTLNQPNNELANYYFKKADEHHNYLDFVVKRGKSVERVSSIDVYRNIDLYTSGWELYAKDFDRIRGIENIIDTCKYYVSFIYNREFNKLITTGDNVIENADFIKKNTVSIYRISQYNLEYEYKEEKKLMEIVQTIPVTDNDLIDEIYSYYLGFGNYTLLFDYLDNNYKHNKSNTLFLNRYAQASLLTGDIIRAKEIANDILRINQKDTEALSTLAEIFCKEEDWEKAGDYSRKAIDYGGEDSNAYFILAESLFKAGEKQEAKRYYNIGANTGFYSDYKEKYKEAGGCPFVINSIDFAFTNYEGDIITDYGQKLLSSKSQYISPRLHVTTDRLLDYEGEFLQCKLFCKGELSTGEDSKNGYTYIWECNYSATAGMNINMELTSWGNNISGNWPSGNYRFEVYYNDELIGEESFYIY